MTEGMIGRINGRSVPIANPGERKVLNTDGTYTASPFNSGLSTIPFNGAAGSTPLPVAGGVGDWLRSQIVGVDVARRLALEVAYDADAATTTGFVQLMLLASSAFDTPLPGDDTWFALPASDGSITAGVTTGVLPTGTKFTKTATFGVQVFNALICKVGPVTANSDKERVRIPFDVTDARWAMVLAREGGDATHPGKLSLAFVGTT